MANRDGPAGAAAGEPPPGEHREPRDSLKMALAASARRPARAGHPAPSGKAGGGGGWRACAAGRAGGQSRWRGKGAGEAAWRMRAGRPGAGGGTVGGG